MIHKPLHDLRPFVYSSSLIPHHSPKSLYPRNTAFYFLRLGLLASGSLLLSGSNPFAPFSLHLVHFHLSFKSQLKCLTSLPSMKGPCILLLWHPIIPFGRTCNNGAKELFVYICLSEETINSVTAVLISPVHTVSIL